MDFDLKKLKVDSHSNVAPVFVGPGIKHLLEGNNCNPTVQVACNINQIEAKLSQREQPADIISNNCKQPVGDICSRGTEPSPSSSGSNHSSESFHTVRNDSSSASIVVETSPTEPCSITKPCESLEAAVNQPGASEVADIGPSLKACTLNTCGVALIIKSADSTAVSSQKLFPPLTRSNFTPDCSKVHKAKEVLGQFIAKGNELKPLKVVCLIFCCVLKVEL